MQTVKNQARTCRSLFNEFKDRYTIQEVEEHAQLAKLFTYLQHRCSVQNGNYIHDPNPETKELLEKFLDYSK